MVFGWGKKENVIKNDIVETELPSNSEITLTEIPAILHDIQNLREKTLIAEIKTFRNKIDSDRKNLLSIVNELKNDNLKTNDIDIHLKILVNRGKSEVISTIQKEFQISFAEINSLNDVFEFEKKAIKSIKKVGDVLGRHTRVIHIFAKKYAKKFKDDLQILDRYIQEIKDLVSNYKSNQEFLDIINQNIEKIASTRNTITKQNKRKIELESLLEHESSKLKELTKTESEIESSAEYNEYITTETKLNNLNEEEKKLRYNIDDNFVKISRPLNKYVHISSLDKPLKIINEKLLVSPYDILTEVESSDLITILDSVQAAISSGAISVKDDKKSIDQIKNVKQVLPILIKEKTAFYQNKDIYLDDLKKFDFNSFNACKTAIQKSKDEVSNLESKKLLVQNQIKENNDLLSTIFTTLEINLKSASSISYKIVSG
jgi:hypothetical protein